MKIEDIVTLARRPHRKELVSDFAPNYDAFHGFPETLEDEVVHWSKFNHNITS